ncbi:MAG TPA: nitrogen fixation protein NifEH [Desulfobacteraceae bacterium]|nr:nitrogen fixation protein NifEH [Desulfobacteraceae bacterium]
MRIAIYGKGGIGKSTITANLAAALAERGKRVLQIGCDPKHDSTRLLLSGKKTMTALDYLRNVAPGVQRLSDVLHTGYKGVVCAEAGGPEPGVGCAGRGILSAFALFDRLGLKTEEFDVILYDVLGDVVCGGFAVPLRKGFADIVYIVTSEEFMSLYAANNILRGVQNFDDSLCKIAGLILNSRGETEDKKKVHRFSEAVRLPVKYTISRSALFSKAEELNKTVVEAFPKSSETKLFHTMARGFLKDKRLFPAAPLEDETLERIVLKGERDADKPDADKKVKDNISEIESAEEEKTGALSALDQKNGSTPSIFFSKSMLCREPLHGCAFTGAICTTTQISGSITVAHAPPSCSHIACQTIMAGGLRALYQKNLAIFEQLSPSLLSSDMNEETVIYGGIDGLVEKLRQAVAAGPEAVFLLTACPAGIIGEDTESAIRIVRAGHPEIPIISVTADGNIRGDYMQGVLNACMEGAGALIDPCCRPEDNSVNIIAEKNIANNAETNFALISNLLNELGISVNCRFVRRTSIEALRNFLKGRLNLPAFNDYFSRMLINFLKERFHISFAQNSFPVGFYESERWLNEIADFFGKEAEAERVIAFFRKKYREMVKPFKKALNGKRIMIITYIHDIDWILETAFDLGMEIAKVCILNYSQDNLFATRYPERFEAETDYPPWKRDEDLRRLKPDLLLCNYIPGDLPPALHADTIPLCPDTGFYGGLAFARRWAFLLKAPVIEGWKYESEKLA